MDNLRLDWVTAVKALAVAAAALWGGLEPLVQLLVILMAVDIVTGIMAAVSAKTLCSEVSFRGMSKKAIALVLVGVASYMEVLIQLPLGEMVAGFYCANEGLSVVENSAEAGLPVPQVLKDALAKLNPEQP